MNNIAVRVSGLSKKYTIGKQKDGSLRGTLGSLFSSGKSTSEDFWALKDLSFEIHKGDVVGIIGKNGAGKSTLLKILSQITSPTEGVIEIDGRIASLLEVGTGFHPELTGRENVYLNGTILGMTRKEVKAKFDEIVAFSGIEKFIDTPVKHYSSGMYVRLAFAVAAHLDPEILIIDEVLAVGDADFQKKCLGKMKDVAGEGRTVLFVSHDLGAVSILCNKGILMNKGQIETTGAIESVIEAYNSGDQGSSMKWEGARRPGDDYVRLSKAEIVDEHQQPISMASTTQKIGICMEFEILKDDIEPVPNIHFSTSSNTYCFVLIADSQPLKKGVYRSVTWVPGDVLNDIVYFIGVAMTTLKSMNIHFWERDILSLEVLENRLERNSDFNGKIPGVVRVASETYITKTS